MQTPEVNWTFNATLKRVIDGDTVELAVDTGFGQTYAPTIRLAGINAPEMVGPDRARAQAARSALLKLLEGQQIRLQTESYRKDGFRRYIGKLWIDDIIDGPIYVNQWMIDQGHAVAFMGAP